jgi:hypothetical protein
MRNENNRRGFSLLLVMASTVLLSSAAAYESFNGPTEMIYSDPSRVAPGYLLFSSWPRLEEYEYTYLVDTNGNVVNKWKTITPEYEGRGYIIEKTARLTESGSIIQGISTAAHNYRGERAIQELDWDGNLTWEFIDPREGYLYHHTFKRIWNNHLNDWTTIYTAQFPMSQQQAVAAGADPSVEWDAAPDGVVEVDRNGNVVWEWWSLDHVVQDKNSAWPNYGVLAEHPERFDLNWGAGLTGDLTHQNALDYNRTLDQIVVNNDKVGELYVIDHGGTFVVGDFEASKALAAGPGGDIVFRWGNPGVYDSGEVPSYNADGNVTSEGDRVLFHHHDTQWVKEGLPGEGNFLIFDNGSRRAGAYSSRLIEVGPYAGSYPNAPYLPEMEAGGPAEQVVWSFAARNANSFFSTNISGVQRLANGNTLGIAGRQGHVFQVTPDGDVVWEYIVPVMVGLPEGATPYQVFRKTMSDADDNAIFTAQWIAPDHPGLVGKDLTPQGKITDIMTQLGRPTPDGTGFEY